ncbi:MAG: winged helix-turn-helix transcriptional regulator [Thermoplasmatota archaeon]
MNGCEAASGAGIGHSRGFRSLRAALPVLATLGVAAGITHLAGSVHGIAALFGTSPSLILFHRVTRTGSFENDTRKRIFEHVCAVPGSCIADIAQGVGVSHSTASYHLDKLVGFNLISGTNDGNKVRYFSEDGVFSDEERRILAALENGETRRVLAMIARNPRCYRAELTALLGVSPPTITWHLERLMGAKLVAEQQDGRYRSLLTDAGKLDRTIRALLSKLEGTGYDATGLQELLQQVST